MVVNKGKGVKVPPKITKKSDKIKPKVTREGKNVSVSNKGPAKRNKVIKTKEASKLLTRNETRSSSVGSRKAKKVSEDTPSMSLKRKSLNNSPKGKLSSSPSKGSLKETKLNKTTPEKMKETKKPKLSKNMTSPTTTSTTKTSKKGNITPPRQTRGGNKAGTSKNQRVGDASQDKLKSPFKKQSP